MNLKYIFGCAVAVATLGVAQAHAASVTVIHGINGLDLGATRELPVDIAVNGTCSLKGVKFTQSTRVSLEKGSYRITVHPSDGSCSAAAVIDQTVTIDERTEKASLTLVASLKSSGTPTLAVYDNTVFGVSVGVRHVALAPAVFVKIGAARYSSQRPTRIKNGGYGALFAVWDNLIDYRITISTSASRGVLARLNGKVRSNRTLWRYFYVVGSLKNGLEIVQQDIGKAELS